MSGLAAAIYLARAGCSVTIFERRRILGGRAITHLRQGYRFNLGPHAVYRGGASSIVYRELGIPVRGGSPPAKGIAMHGGSRYSLPVGELELDLRNDTLSVALPQLSEDGAQGTRIPADNVLLAVDPSTARSLAGNDVINTEYEPVTATCLDVALSRLPSEKNLFALGIDRPHYVSVHSKWAQLTPKGGALIHVAKYRKERAPINDDEIEIDARDKR